MLTEVFGAECRSLAARLDLRAARMRDRILHAPPAGRASLERSATLLEESARMLLRSADELDAGDPR